MTTLSICAQATRAGFLRPRKLAPGEEVALVTPASPLRPAETERVGRFTEILAQWGLVPKTLEIPPGGLPYLAGSDEQRARQIQWAVCSPQIRAIMCLRGGYGSIRILPLLDSRWLEQDPKILVGFSDVTALLWGLNLRAKVVGVHGPTVSSPALLGSPDERTISSLRGLIMDGKRPPPLQGEAWRDGRAQGPLVGGNLSIITSLLGTGFFPDVQGAILFLEDVNEPLYRIDRMIQQLKLAGVLGKVAAVAFGAISGRRISLRHLRQVVLEAVPAGVPVLGNLPFGHGDVNVSLPLGCWSVVDAQEGILEVLEDPFL